MAKEDLLPFKYDAKTNTVFNTSGGKISPVVRTKPLTKSWITTFLDLAARLAAWYALYMIFIGCPPNGRLDPSAAAVCRRFDTVKHSVVPYVKPYYDNYAEPYLARAQPYLQKGQGYYEQFGAPTVTRGQDLWVKQAVPRIGKGYAIVNSQYTKNIYPVLDRIVFKPSRTIYSKYLDSHVQSISTQYSKQVHPHVQTIQTQSWKFFNNRIVPAYHATVPRIQKGLQTAEDAYATHVEPRLYHVLKWIFRKIETVIIPRISIIWNVHVQPQLDRIYDSVFRNREARQVASKIISEGKTTQSLIVSHASSVQAQVEATIDPLDLIANLDEDGEYYQPANEEEAEDGEYDDDADDYEDEEEETSTRAPSRTPVGSENPPLNREVQVDALLENWRTQIRNAGIESEELYLQAIKDIYATEKEREESIAKNMVLELKNTVESEIAGLEGTIMYLAKKGRAEGTDDPRLKELNKEIAAAGKKIRNHAVDIRNYLKTIKERFEKKVLERRKIAWDTMDQVSGNAQIQIGNTWMWLSGITYDDWQQYHRLEDLKNTIKQRIHKAGSGPHFDVIAAIQDEAEADINAVAKEAAGRLIELKDIGREKILLGDGTENFGAGWIPADVKLAADNIKSKVSDMLQATEAAAGIVDQVKEGVAGATDAAASVAESVVSRASEAIYGTPQGTLESILSQATDAAASAGESVFSKASEALYGTPQGTVESILSRASEAVLPDGSLKSKVVSQAQDILESASGIVDDAISQVSTAVYGTPQGVAESIASQISTAVLGTPQGVAESIASQVTSAAAGAYSSASSYASEGVDKIPSYSEVVDQAKGAASSVTSAVGEAVESVSSAASSVASAAHAGIVDAQQRVQKVFKKPEPGVAEKISNSVSEFVFGTETGYVQWATVEGMNMGDDLLNKVSQVVIGTEPGIAEKASSAAVSVGEKIAGQVSEAVYGTPTGIVEQATEAAASAATQVASQISEAVYGTPPGVAEQATSAAVSVGEKIASKASEVVYGTEPDFTEKATSVVGSVASEITSKVAEILEGAESVVSGVASDVTEAYAKATSKLVNE